MSSFEIVTSMVLIALAFAATEFRRHQRAIGAIPHRIHVNGTRGKSSVTRLIGAGLRAGGVSAVTKVTGTFPRLILEDGSEVPVHRKATASILEQLDIVDFAARRGAEALVLECMALEPQYQRITEEQMVHATLSVLTNVRLDHTDVMGRTIEEIGASMANTIPRGGTVITAELEHSGLIARLAAAREAEGVVTSPDAIGSEAMAGFRYIEHRENVALALAVCARVGVPEDVALAGMWRAVPDAGVLSRARVEAAGKQVTLFNAFAANDPDSTLMVWHLLRDEGHLDDQRFILLNGRPDRKERSEHLAHLVGSRLGGEIDRVFVMGEPTGVVTRLLARHGLDAGRVVDLGKATPGAVLDALVEHTRTGSGVVAIGNMGGAGAATVELFERRSTIP